MIFAKPEKFRREGEGPPPTATATAAADDDDGPQLPRAPEVHARGSCLAVTQFSAGLRSKV